MHGVGQQRKSVLGDEYDEDLQDTLIAVLKELGGRPRARDWSMGGSQEISILEVEIGNRSLLVESETYIGLSITGDEDLVERIAALVERRREQH
ncbi:MAG: hypothetical protein P8Q97_01770 [Myxococcota bacterium]|nr:hypothetical protein [Myxococcota bacterium]